jgi:predicted RNA-binding Zn ribbon-like protein
MTRAATPEDIQLWGGALCLDFANSVDWDEAGEHVAPDRTDVLASPDELVRWAARLGLPPVATAGGGELRETRALRDALHRLFSAIAAGETVASDDLARLERSAAVATRAGRLAPHDGAWRLTWPAEEPAAVRFAVALDALRLLDDDQRLARVARCPGRHCGWLFLNTSGRRRWCSMSACGSREKMRRMYERRRAAR